MKPNPLASRAVRWLAILAVTLLALGLRVRAVNLLPIDYDEDDYLRAGQLYAAGLSAGDWSVLTKSNYRVEHPPLSKLAYGVVFAVSHLPPAPVVVDVPITAAPARSLPEPFLTLGRLTSAAFGTLAVLVLALLNPMAALFLSLHTFTIKYTSEVMLDALPSLLGVLAVWLYVRSQGKQNAWWALSAMAAGLAVASKYLHSVAGIAIGLHLLTVTYKPGVWRRPSTLGRWLGPAAAWGLIALAAFWIADPYLWPDPLGRLRESATAVGYTVTNPNVESAGFPSWQPLVWLFGSVPWHPGVFVFPLDLGITLLALAGLRPLWRRHSVFALWLLVGLILLILWRTKWPQYILMLTVPLTVAAAEGFRALIWEPLTQRHAAPPPREPARWRDLGRAAPWLLPGALALLALTAFPLLYQLAVALTDFNALSIRDGIQGGVWRAVWQGLTGQAHALNFRPFADNARSLKVSYVGPGLLLGLFNDASGLFAFEIIWTTLVVAGQTALGVAVALLLARRGVPFKGWWRALFILPAALPEFVGALLWANLTLPKSGWLALAFNSKLNWVTSPELSLLVIVVGAVWMGWPLLMLAATAGLRLIPPEVYDAAAMDGAGPWARFRYVTWPMLWPLLAPAVIVRAIFAFNQFYLFYAFGYLTQGRLPLTTMAAASFFVFSPTFGGQFAVSAAINLLIVLVLLVFILWFTRWSRTAEGVEYAA